MPKPITLSLPQARKLVLHSQRLPPKKITGSALQATLQAVEHLSYIQIDTISVVERAHHHVLWSRNPAYQPAHLDRLVAEKQVFEYWSHAAAYLPMRDFRFSLPRKNAIKSGTQDHWYGRDPRMMRYVQDRIRHEGPLMAKHFDHDAAPTHEWHRKPAKRALEYLFQQGDLMVPARKGFHKVYDLTERVLPDWVDSHPPTATEHARFLITRFLQAHGLAQENAISYLLKGVKPAIAASLRQMSADGELLQALVNGQLYYLLPASLDLLTLPLSRRQLKILSPFDNLLIQRQRMRQLFDFDYLIECYTPAAKRRYGYFSLPILWDGRLVARIDCKAERKQKILRVLQLHLEPGLRRNESFNHALQTELDAFRLFNQCTTLDASVCGDN